MEEQERLQPLSDSQRETLELATATYEEALTQGADEWVAARSLKARGVSKAAAATFRLGVVSDPIPGHNKYLGWLAIPYLDRNGSPLTMRFRCIEPDCEHEYHGKYMSIAGDPSRVFNIRAIHESFDTIHVCEGELDAITLTANGLPAVAIPGASGWQNHHRRMLAGFSRVWVWGDPDDAGAEFTNRVCRALRSAKGVVLKNGDVTDTYLAGGVEALYGLINQEVPAEWASKAA